MSDSLSDSSSSGRWISSTSPSVTRDVPTTPDTIGQRRREQWEPELWPASSPDPWSEPKRHRRHRRRLRRRVAIRRWIMIGLTLVIAAVIFALLHMAH